jgi:hypothetical protein
LPPILKSWAIVPLFVTLKTTGTPFFTIFLESVNLNSLGLPAVTVTFCGVAAQAETATTTAATAAASAATVPLCNVLNFRPSGVGDPHRDSRFGAAAHKATGRDATWTPG